MKKQLFAFLIWMLFTSNAMASVISLHGEGTVGYVSDGRNLPRGGGLDTISGFVINSSEAPSLFNDSLFFTADFVGDTKFYTEVQLNGVSGNLLFNEVNVSYADFKFGRFRVPFGYYVPRSVYSSWNKFQRRDLISGPTPGSATAIMTGGFLPGYETGLMFSGAIESFGYNVYAVQGNGSNALAATTGTTPGSVKDNLSYGFQMTYDFTQAIQAGFSYYANSDDKVGGKNSIASNIFGKANFDAVNVSIEYMNILLPVGYNNNTLFGTFLSSSTVVETILPVLILEGSYDFSKSFMVAVRCFSITKTGLGFSNQGRSAVQLGAEYQLNDQLTVGADYTFRNNEGTELTEDNSITVTTQFKF